MGKDEIRGAVPDQRRGLCLQTTSIYGCADSRDTGPGQNRALSGWRSVVWRDSRRSWGIGRYPGDGMALA